MSNVATVNIDPTRVDIATDPLTQRFRGQATEHNGNVSFDVPFMSHIEGNLYQGGCATGMVLPTNIEHVISLYPWEQHQVTRQPRSYSLHWLYDSPNEPPKIVHAIAAWVNECLEDGPTLVHCQAGLNRSSLIAALTLMLRGRSADEAITLLREKRSPAVLCNPIFESWLRAR